MSGTEICEQLPSISISALMKESSIICVHDTEAGKPYKTNIKAIARAIAKQLAEDGVLPIQGD